MNRTEVGAIILICSTLLFSLFISGISWAADSLLDQAIARHKLDKVEKLVVQKYEIYGSSAQEIRESLNKNGPVDENRIRRDGYTKWQIKWRWPFSSAGKPQFDQTTVQLSIQMLLPDWVHDNTVSKKLISSWEKFIDLLIIHEKKHLSFVLENYKGVEQEIHRAFEANPRLTTEQANQIGYKVLNQIRALDRDYDKQTDNGKVEGIKFPRVESNE